MPSLVWGRDPQEAFRNPYEYEANEQFLREASLLLPRLYRLLYTDRRRYKRDERSVEKAIWLLQMDALDSLEDALAALKRKNHRIAGKLFRNIIEALDLAAYFHQGGASSTPYLEAWFNDEVVPHRVYREFIKRTQGDEPFEESRRHYHSLSKFAHRTYRAIMDGYSLGAEERLVHDRVDLLYDEQRELSNCLLVLPHTVSAYLATLGNLIMVFADEIGRRGMVNPGDVEAAMRDSLEVETVPRHFMPSEWLLRRNLPEESSEVDGDEP